MHDIKSQAPFLSDAWRRLTYYARGDAFRAKSGDVQGKGEKGKKGQSTGGLGLGTNSLELTVPAPQPPFEMTSPLFLTATPSNNRLVPQAFWKLSEADKKIEKELKAAGISYADFVALRKERLGFTVDDMHRHAHNQRNKPVLAPVPVNSKWATIALRHGVMPSLKPTYKNPELKPQPELTPAPELRLIPPFNPRPRPR